MGLGGYLRYLALSTFVWHKINDLTAFASRSIEQNGGTCKEIPICRLGGEARFGNEAGHTKRHRDPLASGGRGASET